MEPLDSLVRAAQEGDAEVFNRIVERFQDMACASAYAMIEDVHLAEDVAQEAFLEAYLNLAKLREPAAFSSWFRRIILKQADRLTRGKCLTSSSLEVVADVPMDGHSPTEIAETNEVRERMHRAISALPERERLVIVLFYGTGYALKEIAAFLDIPVTTVKKRLYDARQRLKDELIDVMRDVLQEQRPSSTDTFPAKVRLLIAARLGNIDIVKELLARSPMLLNRKTERGEARNQSVLSAVAGLTALHEAAMHHHAQLAQLLCEYGANSNARTSSGLTPLHGAVLSHCHETAAVLLTHGANPELALSSGLTALHLAAMKGLQRGLLCMTNHRRFINKDNYRELTAIYQADQEVEAEERSSFSRGGRSRPASQWRPMPYASSFPGRLPFPVKKHLSWTEQISEGTGSTLEALEKRGLIAMQHLSVEVLRSRGIITKWQGILEPEPILVIEITPLGRKMVRQALGIQMTRHVTGTLQEWHWRALVLAYVAREGKGVAMEYGHYGDYGRIGWKAWLRLREYSPAPLIQVYHEQSSGSPYTNYYVQITSFGIAFYGRAIARYQALYPSIEAPAPLAPLDPFEPYSEMGQGHETCRACQGEYLVEITRTYQQTRNFTWRVEEQASRIPGRVESPYGEVEQCLCQEEEIQETSAPFLVLLDRLVEQGWQVSFPHHHWIDYLDYLVGGVSLGRERRWYDPELAKAKVLPLLDDTAIDDARNVVKGDMRYCWNEHVGKGSIYPQGLSGGLSMRPVTITCAKETNR